MIITIDEEILRSFPEAGIGCLAADIGGCSGKGFTEELKHGLEARLNDIGISADTMMKHPDVMRWREVFGAMGVKPSKYRCSLEALLRRLFRGELWNVSEVVDLYNCISVLNLMPMGAHDLDMLDGDLTLRHAQRGGERLY